MSGDGSSVKRGGRVGGEECLREGDTSIATDVVIVGVVGFGFRLEVWGV